jgi:hypothetical protein
MRHLLATLALSLGFNWLNGDLAAAHNDPPYVARQTQLPVLIRSMSQAGEIGLSPLLRVPQIREREAKFVHRHPPCGKSAPRTVQGFMALTQLLQLKAWPDRGAPG